MITNKLIFDTLLSDLQDQEIKRIIIGINWTLIETAVGCGLAHTPRRDEPGCQPIAEAGKLSELGLAEAAKLILSGNPIEIAIGMAAVNASYNRYDLSASEKNGLDAFAEIDGPITVIGRFPGLAERIDNLQIIEKEPREGEYGEQDAARLLPESAGVIITSSALVNGSAGSLLDLAKNSRVCMVGPSTPFAPKLFDLGVEFLAGTIVTNIDQMAIAVAEGGAVKALKPYGSFKTLAR
ncbi:MAG: hypothetical protein HON14_02730 [Rhodospirillaceae bacterium]|jgi:uncharacterized protein|nr:hypothetical protein [Rhodospirillaceae bacterium]MBT4589153.1 hypothetical protein [Rhodospirillaceae bacterium]MBT4938020.1 hypothetical protein [Rhodospirillaceae bacterium]MBT5940472.1 hypothetical protein [Rhodospirillaceae bacterium]MBT7268508.1 hypothetical protein [Rhodospirillaceae bacterium]